MKDKDFQIAVSQVNSILKRMSSADIEKIPKKFRKFLKENNKEEYNTNIRTDIPLNKQGLNPETMKLLAVIYRNYLCEDKKAYDKLLQENQKKYEEELRKKYEIKFKTKK